ncbi:MAG: hypothetical protein WC867_06700 [Candidatus Pacearchaeota archaeon]|jgi:hypothetical protein
MVQDNLSVEYFFFSYAFPALEKCTDRLTKEEISKYEDMAVGKESPSKEELEKLFPKSFERIKKYAEKLKIKNHWDIKVIKGYWYEEHNRIIDSGESGYNKTPSQLRKPCKVDFAMITKPRASFAEVKVKKNKDLKRAINYLNLHLFENEYVTIHLGHIIEKISEEVYKKYA